MTKVTHGIFISELPSPDAMPTWLALTLGVGGMLRVWGLPTGALLRQVVVGPQIRSAEISISRNWILLGSNNLVSAYDIRRGEML